MFCGRNVDSKEIHNDLAVNPCAIGTGGSRNTSPSETGTSPGATPGDVPEAGRLVTGAGARHWRAVLQRRKAGKPAGSARRDQARPPPSHTWRGPCSIGYPRIKK